MKTRQLAHGYTAVQDTDDWDYWTIRAPGASRAVGYIETWEDYGPWGQEFKRPVTRFKPYWSNGKWPEYKLNVTFKAAASLLVEGHYARHGGKGRRSASTFPNARAKRACKCPPKGRRSAKGSDYSD